MAVTKQRRTMPERMETSGLVFIGQPLAEPSSRAPQVDVRWVLGLRVTNARTSRGPHGHAAAVAHPALALQREGALDARLQAHRAPPSGARPRLPDPRLARDGARHAANPVPGGPGDRRFDAYHRRARRALSRAAAVSR